MRIVADVLKLVGALLIATIFGHPETFPRLGPGLFFFLGTFGWPLLFAAALLVVREGPASMLMRVLEVLFLPWTAFMIWFATGMDPSRGNYIMVAGVVAYTVGMAWSDVLFLLRRRRAPAL